MIYEGRSSQNIEDIPLAINESVADEIISATFEGARKANILVYECQASITYYVSPLMYKMQ